MKYTEQQMLDFLGQKVVLATNDGMTISGYVFDVLQAEDSDIGSECVDIAAIDREAIIEIPLDVIREVLVDAKYIKFDFTS